MKYVNIIDILQNLILPQYVENRKLALTVFTLCHVYILFC